MNYKLAIVVPCYKEEAVLAETTKRLTKLLDDLIISLIFLMKTSRIEKPMQQSLHGFHPTSLIIPRQPTAIPM